MIPLLKSIKQYGITSPYGPVLISCALFLLAWLFPSGVYTQYMEEPDRMFLDPLTAIFFFLCVAAFLLGLKVQRSVNPAAWRRSLPELRSLSPILYLGGPLLAAIASCGIYLVKVGAKLNILAILTAGQGSDVKALGATGAAIVDTGVWGHAPLVLAGVLWWSFLRMRQLKLAIEFRVSFILLWSLGLLLGIFTDVAMVDRTRLMPLVAGCVLIFVFSREVKRQLRFGRIAFYGVTSFALLAGLFTVLAVLRGNTASNLVLSSLLGYTIVSYNRLASLLHGQMSYLYGGRGIYLFHYLQEGGNTLNKIVGFRGTLNWPTANTVWQSEFSSVALSGLNNRYVWAGVFGYLYADLGWGAPVYVFFAGMLAGYTWQKFKRGSTLAVTCYPWIAVWIVFWHGWNMLFTIDLSNLVFTGIVLAAWDRLLTAVAVPSGRKISESDLGAVNIQSASA